MKRILMLSSQPMFSRGVETLLRHVDGLEVIGWETNVDRAVERIRECRPDVVILDTREPDAAQSEIVMRILRERVQTRVIALNLENTSLCVYQGEERQAQDVRDLCAAIQEATLSKTDPRP